MPTLDLVVIVTNMGLAALAVVACVVGTFRDDPRRRPLWGAIAALAAAYVGGYIWVLAGGDVALWSRIFRGVSIAAWPLVWTVPPLLLSTWHRRDQERLAVEAQRVHEERRR